LFTAIGVGVGRELWVTDGTVAGTLFLKDIYAGSETSWPNRVAVIQSADGKRLVFLANDGSHGRELWVSDGTVDGTAMLADIFPGGVDNPIWPMGDWPSGAPPPPQRIFFLADDADHGRELWITDGTTAGTHLVRDIRPGAASSAIATFEGSFFYKTVAGDTTGELNFLADDGIHGLAMWMSDGTVENTRLYNEGNPGVEGFGIDTYASQLSHLGYEKIWVIEDWTAGGYVALFDHATGRIHRFAQPLRSGTWEIVNGHVFFLAQDPLVG
jgi:ELWxxDGT repeat protein